MSLFDPNNRRLRNVYLGISLLGCLLFLAGLPYGLGFLAGTALALVIYEWNVHYWNRVLDTRRAGRGTGFPHFLINFTLMGALLLTSVYKPQYLNIFTAAAGLFSVKSAIIVEELFFRRKEAEQ